MDPLIGAAIAAWVAWLSILVVIHLPWRLPVRGLRRAGAAALAVMAASVLGAPVPVWASLIVLGGGVILATSWRGAAAA